MFHLKNYTTLAEVRGNKGIFPRHLHPSQDCWQNKCILTGQEMLPPSSKSRQECGNKAFLLLPALILRGVLPPLPAGSLSSGQVAAVTGVVCTHIQDQPEWRKPGSQLST